MLCSREEPPILSPTHNMESDRIGGSCLPLFIGRSEDTASRKLDGEMLVAAVRTSTLFTLNELATFIWESADGQTSLDEIVDRICSQYDVDRETALHDAIELAEKLVSNGILLRSESAFPKDKVGNCA